MRIRWLPSSLDSWNGIITRYTIQYSLLRQVSSATTDILMTLTSDVYSSNLVNNPDPILATSPLMWEELDIEGLKAYFIYSFSIYYENSAGQSASSNSVELGLPITGILDYCY